MTDETGAFRIDVEIANQMRPHERELIRTVLVDTGAMLSWFPARVLESLGITRLQQRHFRQADGTVISRWTGAALVRVGSRTTFDEVVFGEFEDSVVFGARSLSGLNLCIDPETGQLVDGGPAPAAAA